MPFIKYIFSLNTAKFIIETAAIRKSRAGVKSKITVALNILNDKYEKGELIKELFVRQQETILKSIAKIEEKNEEIDLICDTCDIDTEDSDRIADIGKEQEYLFNVQSTLVEISSKLEEKEVKPNLDKTDTNMSTVDALAALLAKNQSDALKPKLHCATFSGKEQDRLEFKNF